MNIQKLATMAGACLVVTACVAATPPVNVTRFHNAETAQISPGTVAITSVIADDGSISLERRTFEAAVLHELQQIGFQEERSISKATEYLARVSVEQSRITAEGRRSPVSVGVGGRTGSYGSGVGLGVGINLSGPPKDKIATELSVRITRQSDSEVVWEGRSSVEAKDGSPASQPGLAAAKLAEALFRDFPGESGATIRVP